MYDLGSSEDFFFLHGDENINPSELDKPRSLYQALCVEKYNFSNKWENILNHYDISITFSDSDIRDVLERIREVDTCTNLNSPIEVWVTKNGDIRVAVYDT